MADGAAQRSFGVRLTPLTRRRLRNFRNNRRAFVSLWVFLLLFAVTLPAEFIANDKPLLIQYGGGYYFPVFAAYPETAFGGDFETEAEYPRARRPAADPRQGRLDDLAGDPLQLPDGQLRTRCPPPRRRRRRTIGSAPTTRRATCWRARSTDSVSRLLFGLSLTVLGSIIGVAVGAAQGYFGGWTDLAFQALQSRSGRACRRCSC